MCARNPVFERKSQRKPHCLAYRKSSFRLTD